MQKSVRGGGVVCIASEFLQLDSILLFLIIATLQASDFFLQKLLMACVSPEMLIGMTTWMYDKVRPFLQSPLRHVVCLHTRK